MKAKAQEIFSLAGININGNKPWDIQIHDERFYARVLSGGSLALGESYMDGWWDCKNLDQFFDKILSAKLDKKIRPWKLILTLLKAKIINMQNSRRAFHIGEHHYDTGNNLYKCMLDKHMQYTCGYWKNAKTLDEAQEAKLDLICKKLQLKKGMTLLDIGCGWGGLLRYAACKYGVKGVGITVSKEQAKLARSLSKGLPIKIKLQDYRKETAQYDRIVSVGMIEHVGNKNYRTYMEMANRCLKDNGLFLLHTIAGVRSVHHTDPWISKYIFPNSMLPSAKQLTESMEGFFIIEDWHSFGAYYDKTLMAWEKNFRTNWSKIKSRYDERFYRMWRYYLLACAGSFRARKNQLWQIVLSKDGIRGGYERFR